MAITIKSHSLQGNPVLVASVYNPINYIVDSNLRGRDNFSYVADIYYSGTTVGGTDSLFAGRLFSFPNLQNYYGQFDVHRVLENYVSSDPGNFSVGDMAYQSNSTKRFVVKFGESFSTKNAFSSFAQGPQIFPGAYYLKVNFPQPHNLVAGDGVYMVKDDITIDAPLHNMTTRVLSANSTTQVTLEAVFGTGGTAQTGYVYEGTSFSSTTSTNGFLTLQCKTPHNFVTGDTVVIAKYVTSINPDYDGAWTVKSVSSSTIFTVNAPFGTVEVNESGTVYKKGNKVLTGLTVSTGFTFMRNSVDDYGDYYNFGRAKDFEQYTLKSSTSKFLTNAPRFRVREGDWATMSFLHGGLFSATTNAANLFIYTFVDYSGNTYTNEFEFPAAYTGLTNPDIVDFTLPTGPKNIDSMLYNEILPGNLSAGTFSWSDIDYYYIVAFKKFTLSAMSQFYRFDVDNSCTKYDVYRLMFRNRLGGFDYFNFTKRNDTSYTIDKSVYERQLGRYSQTDYGYTVGDRGKIVNNVNITEKVTAYSDWITEEEAAWLYELFASPEVYIISGDSDTDMIPIIITSNEYVVGKKANQKLINYKIDFEYAYEKFSQRG